MVDNLPLLVALSAFGSALLVGGCVFLWQRGVLKQLRLKQQAERDLWQATQEQMCADHSAEVASQQQMHQTALLELELRKQSEIDKLEVALQAANARIAEEKQRFSEYKQDDQSKRLQMQDDFKRLASQVLESKQSIFTERSRETLDATLRPLREQLAAFRTRVDQVHSSDVADRNKLQGQIEALQKQAQKIGSDAVDLANALKGDSKIQGNWGEVILAKLLQSVGLEAGVHYQTQAAYTDADGRRQLPDVVLHLPEGKAIVIDSKVSLLHYQAYVSETNESERAGFLNKHIASLEAHYKGLSNKRYEQLTDLKTVDFVFMFVPIEPAYLLALREKPSLFDDAFSRNVTLVSHTTLMPMLKTVQALWRNENQNKNALEIARQAGGIYDKVAGVLEALEQLESYLGRAQSAFTDAKKRLHTGSGNLISRVEKIKKLGAKAEKSLPDTLLERTDDLDQSPQLTKD